MKIAVVGSGISGLSCAWLLDKKHDVAIFEKNNYLGGHSNTVSIDYDGQKIDVDTGFIVFNYRTYPNLKAFFDLLKVKVQKSNMSFGVKNLESNLEYSADSLSGLFAQKKNLLNIKFLAMLKDIIKFNKYAIRLVESKEVISGSKTLGDFVDELSLGKYFQDYYLLPMVGAIWSCPFEMTRGYPAKTFLQFFYNHGLLTITNQPQWYTVAGGSKEYVKRIAEDFRGRIKMNCNIVKSEKTEEGVVLTDSNHENYEFDHVIFASHSDQTYKIISDKTKDEEGILSKMKYGKNIAVLHKDKSQMPKKKKAWASWVYLYKEKQGRTSLSYWMNNLQNISHKKPLFVTLNPIEEIGKSDIFGEYKYEHPIFDKEAIVAQENLHKIQGVRNIWFCGAWTGYGFHEDGLNSAINVARLFEVEVPWKKS